MQRHQQRSADPDSRDLLRGMSMRALRKLTIVPACLAWILLAACGSESSGQESQTAPEAEQKQSAESPPQVEPPDVADSRLEAGPVVGE